MLEGVGLGDDEWTVYRALVERPSASVEELVRDLGLADGCVDEALAGLERRGLADRQAADVDRFAAAPPGIALRALLAEQERRIDVARGELFRLEGLYSAATMHHTMSDIVSVISGGDAVRRRFGQIQVSAREEVRVFVRADVPLVTAQENEEEDHALGRGVRYRVVAEKAVLAQPGFVAMAREASSLGEQVRIARELPSRLLIVDDRLAMLPLHWSPDDRTGALIVHPSSLLDLLIDAFDRIWDASALLTEPPEAAASPLSESDRAVLRLLVTGATDSWIATQLEVSVRTVQRNVSALMATAGVTTRFQLGAEAVRLGWL